MANGSELGYWILFSFEYQKVLLKWNTGVLDSAEPCNGWDPAIGGLDMAGIDKMTNGNDLDPIWQPN